MSKDQSFQDLVRRARASDQEAWTELVRRFEPAIRRAVKVRLVDPRLKRARDAEDFCQSIWSSLFVGLAWGQFDFDTPEDLLKVLAAMVRHKVADYTDKEFAQSRDARRTYPLGSNARAAVDRGSSPSQHAALLELIEKLGKQLTPDIRRLAEARKAGQTWDQIAAACGENASTLRQRCNRAMNAAMKKLGLDA
jgi:RNA polymerase sigma factor (sigma-70 family)